METAVQFPRQFGFLTSLHRQNSRNVLSFHNDYLSTSIPQLSAFILKRNYQCHRIFPVCYRSSQRRGHVSAKNYTQQRQTSSFQQAPLNSSRVEKSVLYSFPLAYNVQKVRLGLEEKGFPYEQQFVNAVSGEHLTAAYLKINPNGTVPSLKLPNGEILTDSTDILRHVDSQGEPLGGEDVSSSKADEWYEKINAWEANLYTFIQQPVAGKLLNDYRLKVAQAELKRHPEVADLLKQRIDFFKKYSWQLEDPSIKESLDAQLRDLLDDGDAQLRKSRYAAGNAFSMSDVLLMNLLARTELNGKFGYISSRPALAKYWSDMKLRPSYQKVVGYYLGPGVLPVILPTISTVAWKSLFNSF